jgi:Sulfotransferase domain
MCLPVGMSFSSLLMATEQLPDFLFIGPDKTGSSWMYEVLRMHPQCFVPEAKDLYFFTRYYHFGIDWYRKFFQPVRGAPVRMTGELSHDYLFSELAANRIQKHLPDVKLITCLRDPAERTFSHYLYLVRSGLTRAPFLEALRQFPELINNSRYATHLEVYLKRFPREQLLILNFNEFKTDSREFARHLFDFLNLDFIEELPYDNRVLSASRPRSRVVARMMKVGANQARRFGLANAVGRIKRGSVRRLVYAPYSENDRPRLLSSDRRYLEQIFKSEVISLRKILGPQANDFGDWTSALEHRDQV